MLILTYCLLRRCGRIKTYKNDEVLLFYYLQKFSSISTNKYYITLPYLKEILCDQKMYSY